MPLWLEIVVSIVFAIIAAVSLGHLSNYSPRGKTPKDDDKNAGWGR